MGGATLRFITFLSSPLPLLHPHRPSSLFLRRLCRHTSYRTTLSPSPTPPFLSPSKCSHQLHTHSDPHTNQLPPLNSNDFSNSTTLSPSPTPPFLSPSKCSHQLHTHSDPHTNQLPPLNSNDFSNSTTTNHHPWFEYSGFVTRVSQSGYCNAPLDVHQFVGGHRLDEDFLRDANSCLEFAREHPTLLWSLSREDIEVVVKNGSPFLFTNASATVARMKSFLNGSDNVLESDKPSTVHLVEYLLSYAHMAIGFQENMQMPSRVESSVRKLFSELAKSKGNSVEVDAAVQKHFNERYGQAPRSFRKIIEMKKGDWICPSCSFMNFAKNSQCHQCEERRPKKLLTGGEWECPQCDFFNFGRNVVCLRCDCKKPAIDRFLSPTSLSALRTDTSVERSNTEELIAGTEEEQQWLTKISQLVKSSDTSNALMDEDLPETMKSGDNRSTLSSTRNLGTADNFSHSNLQAGGENSDENSFNVKTSQYPDLDEFTGNKSYTYTSIKGGDLGKNSRASSTSALSSSVSSQYGDTYAPAQQQMSDEKPLNQLGNIDNEREQDEQSERWFKKVAELHDVKDLPSAISDNDFPEIMPMRKVENQFVVSKKKDRSLTSPMYKRRAAMEQAGNNSYVPFVPFPPGYFSKDKPQEFSELTQSNEQNSAMSLKSGGAGERIEIKSSNPVSEASNNLDKIPKTIDSASSSPSDYSKSQSTSEDSSVKDSWRESLEGSAVKEPDPLDMSEEAKAERWFRRVAQIKDISELSQIPDEDFPSIMPMRKGVNRFVVSKRKTPLERRLTSSQYRRNLPVVRSDSVNNETDSN